MGKSSLQMFTWPGKRAKNVKWRAIDNLDKNLEQFESLLTRRGGKVIWAEDAKRAVENALKFARRKIAKPS